MKRGTLAPEGLAREPIPLSLANSITRAALGFSPLPVTESAASPARPDVRQPFKGRKRRPTKDAP